MADFFEKVKEFILKIVKIIKDLVAKITGKGGEEEGAEAE